MILVCRWNHKTTQKKYFKLHHAAAPVNNCSDKLPNCADLTLVQSVQCVRHCTRNGPKSTVLCFVAIVQVIPIFVMAKTFFESTKQLLFLNSAMQLQIWF